MSLCEDIKASHCLSQSLWFLLFLLHVHIVVKPLFHLLQDFLTLNLVFDSPVFERVVLMRARIQEVQPSGN